MIKLVWVLKVAPQEKNLRLHEFGLSWYQFEEKIENFEKSLQHNARPAVWIEFSKIEQLERIQGAFSNVKLGPATSFSEALIIENKQEKAEEIMKRTLCILNTENEVDEMEVILREDSLEDY